MTIDYCLNDVDKAVEELRFDACVGKLEVSPAHEKLKLLVLDDVSDSVLSKRSANTWIPSNCQGKTLVIAETHIG